MRSKYTNQELYDWMVGKVSSVYYGAYKLAFDVAKKAERCFAYEIGGDVDYISYGYWDNLEKGLMAHEALLADIKRMEASYLDRNKRPTSWSSKSPWSTSTRQPWWHSRRPARPP